jgi:tetratricopeptide (TPR) repeat protein
MKRITLLFFAVITALSTCGQTYTYLQEGDRCFDDGEYACAINRYGEAFKSASGKDKQVAEIKLTRAKWCAEHLETATRAFADKDYKTAKDSYLKVLDSNPKDEYVTAQLEKCEEMLGTVLKISTENLSFPYTGGRDTVMIKTNADSYSVNHLPQWCKIQRHKEYLVVICDANPNKTARTDYITIIAKDKTVKINVSQAEAPTTLSVSSNVHIGIIYSNIIYVKTNANGYQITDLPAWCRVYDKRSDWFELVCDYNNSKQPRTGKFKIVADDKEEIINIEQSRRPKRCFNCPKDKDDFINIGLTFGIATTHYYNYDSRVQIGLIYEPRFKYGFGLNFGLNYEWYSDDSTVKNNILNINADFEYLFNFSQSFNPYIYGGTSFDYGYSTVSDRFCKYIDLGAGIRIDHFRINAVKNIPWSNIKSTSGFAEFFSSHRKFTISIAYMF